MKYRPLFAATSCIAVSSSPLLLKAEESGNHFSIGIGAGQSEAIYNGLEDKTQVLPLLDFKYNHFFMTDGGLGYRFLEREDYGVFVGLGADLFENNRGDSQALKDMGECFHGDIRVIGGDAFTPVGLLGFNLRSDISNKQTAMVSTYLGGCLCLQ